MSTTRKGQNNSLSVCLTEPVVFLRGGDITGRQRPTSDVPPPAMVRGLLVLDIVKPMRITSIEVELVGKSQTSWPEGVGARRIEVSEEHQIFSASTVFFRAASGADAPRRTMSLGPGTFPPHEHDEDTSESDSDAVPAPVRGRPRNLDRRVSADQSFFQRDWVSYHSEEGPALQIPPTPPYTPHLLSPTSSEVPSYTEGPRSPHPQSPMSSAPMSPSASVRHLGSLRSDEDPRQILEESRNALLLGLQDVARRRSLTPLNSAAPSVRSVRSPSDSRRQSLDDTRAWSDLHPPPVAARRSSPVTTRRPSEQTDETESEARRGRKKSRFSLTAVLGSLKERVGGGGSRSPHVENPSASTERGRAREKGKQKASASRERGDGWKEFRKGTYTYPISFAVPANAPPSIHCAFGSVSWRLKAQVHRPGAFTPRITATRQVQLVACPGEEDLEDQDNIVVERQWDSQLQYLISVSGRTFYIGGTIPIHITLMPLAKVKVHRISVFLDERVDYLTQMKRVARSDQPSRTVLLALRDQGSDTQSLPILPLNTDDPQAYARSPLAALDPPDADERAAAYMGPGPWTIDCALKMPASCAQLHFTAKNKRSNISVGHALKIVFRVERGDDQFVDAKTGKRKLFDIVVQTPVHVLSCLCGPEMTSLPRYAELIHGGAHGGGASVSACGCHEPRRARVAAAHTPVRRSSDESVATLSTVESRSSAEEALLQTNALFERLVAGRETESGEAPPSYDVAVAERFARGRTRTPARA